jgi:hypothetical protein
MRGWVLVGGGRINGGDKGRWIVDVLYMLIWNRIMKLVAIILNRGCGEGGTRERDDGGEPNQGTMRAYMEISRWIPPIQLIYANKNALIKVSMSVISVEKN